MGTNQNLLIVLGIIIVGVAVIAGVMLFKTSFDEGVKDIALQKVHEIGGLANKYYSLPKNMGGGEKSYTGFVIPEDYLDDYFDMECMTYSNQNVLWLYLYSNTETYKGKPYRFYALYQPDGLKALYLYEPDDMQWVKLYDRRWAQEREDD